MALTVPAGIELGDADSYISLVYADAYHEALGHTSWISIDDDERREWLLRRASMIIDARYTWVDPTDFTSVPRPVQLATAELAYHYVENAPSATANIKSVQVGAIQVEFDNATAGTAERPGIWAFIDMVLSGLAEVPSVTTASGVSIITVERA